MRFQKHFIKIKKIDRTYLVSVRANLFMKKLGLFIIIVLIFSGCGDASVTSSLPQASIPTTTSEVLQESDLKLPEPLPLIAIHVGEAEQPMVLINKPDGDGFLLAERKGQIKNSEINEDGSLSVGETLFDFSDAVSTAGEGGLLGMAFSKDGSQLFVNYTAKPMTTRVSSFTFLDGLTGVVSAVGYRASGVSTFTDLLITGGQNTRMFSQYVGVNTGVRKITDGVEIYRTQSELFMDAYSQGIGIGTTSGDRLMNSKLYVGYGRNGNALLDSVSIFFTQLIKELPSLGP